MRITAFYNEFDTVATCDEVIAKLCKMLPHLSKYHCGELMLAASAIYMEYLTRTKLEKVEKEAFRVHAQDLELGPRAFLLELLDHFTYRETFQWASDPQRKDGVALIERLSEGSSLPN